MDEEIIAQETYNLHYIKTDETGRIIDGWSNGPCPDKDTTEAICINDDRGIPLYKWDGAVLRRTQEEIDADYVEPEPVPSETELLRAQVNELQAQLDALLGVE